MPTLSNLATLAAFSAGQATAVVTPLIHKNGYTLARSQKYQDTVLIANNTVNSTEPVNFVGGEPSKHWRRLLGGGAAKRQIANLPISLANNFAGPVNAYITGTDESGAKLFLGPNSAAPLQVTLPTYLTFARVYFAASGSLTFLTNGASGVAALVQPSVTNQMDSNYGTNWGLAEFTNTAGGLYINPSQMSVDFAGIPVGIAADSDGTTVSTPGLRSGTVQPICQSLSEKRGADGQPWAATYIIATDGVTLLRALAPNSYRTLQAGAFDGYYDESVNQVYSTYNSGNFFTISGSPGGSTCTSDGTVTTCTGDEITYNKPNSGDIFACDGDAGAEAPFASRGS